MMVIGEVFKLNFDREMAYTVRDIIEDVNLPLLWTWDLGKCPDCNVNHTRTDAYVISRVVVMESNDGDVEMLGYSNTDIPFTFRLPTYTFEPSKNMIPALLPRSEFLRSKYNG